MEGPVCCITSEARCTGSPFLGRPVALTWGPDYPSLLGQEPAGGAGAGIGPCALPEAWCQEDGVQDAAPSTQE